MNALLWLRAGALFGFLAVALGSFGAHWLTSHLESTATTTTPSDASLDPKTRPPLTVARRLEVFDTGVRYQMFHALALLAIGLCAIHTPASPTWLNVAGAAFTIGILLFSGSLYLLGYTGIRWLGAITPLGGVAYLIGWAALFISLGLPSQHT